MEQRLWRETEEKFNGTLAAGDSLYLQTLSSIRSLIVNPSTSDLTISSILKTLTLALSLHHHHRRRHNHHIFSLLSDLHHRHTQLSLSLSTSAVFQSSSLLSDPNSSARLAAAALSLLLSISAVDVESIDESLVISLCFRPCVSVRVWILKNALRFRIRPNLLLTVLLGFTKDPYPCVRQAALDGLVGVCVSGVEVDDCEIVEGCYFRSVELLRDREDYIRVSAVCAVTEWGQLLASSKQEGDMRDWSNAVFLQVCAMVRDMNVGVRVEAFTALGKIGFVSEDILLQTLSKKVLGTIKEKKSLAPCRARLYEIHASLAAGVFIHGLEDEYGEVQRAACVSLRMLAVLSGRFSGEAADLLTYVLNDDSMIVRLEALETLHHMVTSGYPKMQEEHIDIVCLTTTLLGTLVDNSPKIRLRALNILGLIRLPDMQVYKTAIQGLLGTLEIYPQNEGEIFRTLFSMGQNHGNYAVSIIEEFYHEINPSCDGKFDFNSSRVAGLLVLAISASLKHEKYLHRISPRIFSYAAAFYGRISHAFGDMLDKDFLLAYLSNCGDWGEVESESGPRLKQLPAGKGKQEAIVSAHVLNSAKLTFATIKNLWQLVTSGCTSEVLKALRCCNELLKTVRTDSLEYTGVVAFALQYICIVKLLAKIWAHFVVLKQHHLHRIGETTFLLKKLNKTLLALRYTFIGLTEEDELYILELLLLSYVLTLSSFHLSGTTLKKISTTIKCVDILRNGKSNACSEFENQLAELSSKGILTEAYCNSLQLKKLLDTFILKDFSLTQRIRHVSVELCIPTFNSVSPLRFISGLPVGIPLELTLYNVTSEHKIWIKMTLDEELTEFVFLDVEQYGGLELKKFEFTAPFYRTPKAIGFNLRVNIVMECASEDLHLVKGYGGPNHSLVSLCPEKEVYFVMVDY